MVCRKRKKVIKLAFRFHAFAKIPELLETHAHKKLNFQLYHETKMSKIIVFWSNHQIKMPRNVVFWFNRKVKMARNSNLLKLIRQRTQRVNRRSVALIPKLLNPKLLNPKLNLNQNKISKSKYQNIYLIQIKNNLKHNMQSQKASLK